MTHTLCLDNCQTFSFTPTTGPGNEQGVTVCRKFHASKHGWYVTGTFFLPLRDGRNLWQSLIKDGAFPA
jgi:hypothetical protein